jgi:hypothetical protein
MGCPEILAQEISVVLSGLTLQHIILRMYVLRFEVRILSKQGIPKDEQYWF